MPSAAALSKASPRLPIEAVRLSRATVSVNRTDVYQAGKIPDMIVISERPAEVADRAIPRHWEGDLILGSNCRSAIATSVERQTRFVMLFHLPDDHGAIAVRDGLLATITTLPERLRKTLTWNQGTELAQHKRISMATKMAIYLCDPHSPRQCGPNENADGLRQYFPRSTDHAKPSAAAPPPKPCSDCYSTRKNQVLRQRLNSPFLCGSFIACLWGGTLQVRRRRPSCRKTSPIQSVTPRKLALSITARMSSSGSIIVPVLNRCVGSSRSFLTHDRSGR